MRLIDAEALVRELNNSHYPGAPYVDAGISIAIGKVCDAPTIDPVRRGKWIDGRCSQCGGEAYWKGRRDVYGWQEFALELTKYCPNCGSLNVEEGD